MSDDKAVNFPKNDIDFSYTSLAINAVQKFTAIGAIYAVGYWNLSFGWLVTPIIYYLIRDYWHKKRIKKRALLKSMASEKERDIILANVNDLPSWVFFPDVERTEWLNNILKQCWPYVNKYAKDLIKTTIEPNLKTTLASYKLNGFQFQRIILGSIPPKLAGIKVYDKNVSRKEIIMDVNFFYSGDCDITFTLGAAKAGIKDFQIHGLLRIVMKPLITQVPIVGGVQIYFLNNPTVDFDFVGLADFLDMPGLSGIIRKIIMDQIAAMMVLPNKYAIKLNEDVEFSNILTTEPEGVLRVHMIEAKNLVKKDFRMLGRGKSDPYAIISLGANEYRTPTIQNSLNPKWDFWCEFIVTESSGQRLTVDVWDYDEMPKDDETLGKVSFELDNVIKYGESDKWVTLEEIKHGMVHLRMTWFQFSVDFSDLKIALNETKLLQVTNMSSAICIVYIDSAKNLPQVRTASRPDPFVKVFIGDRKSQTPIQLRTCDPVYEKGFHFLLNDPLSDCVHFLVVDNKTELELGLFSYDLSKLLEKKNMEIQKQPFQLEKSGQDSKIIITLALKILKSKKSEDCNVDDSIKKQSVDSEDSAISSNNSPYVKVKELEKGDAITENNSLNLSNERLSEVRSRTPTHSMQAGEYGLGRIQLTLRYSTARQKLIVVVHKIVNLVLKDKLLNPDPYIKLYLLPERSKESKRKTLTVKENCNPIYDETFEYTLSPGEIHSGYQIEVTVFNHKKLFQTNNDFLGQVIIDLQSMDLSKGTTSWFDLTPENLP